jgi:hypothetical protein
MKKNIILGVLAVLVIIQFFHPTRNESNDETTAMSKAYNMPDNVTSILKAACYDCHSNKTAYPWYANVQPVAWWLDHHVTEGKQEINFSAFTQRKIAVQNHKFEEIAEQVEKKEMPDPEYTLFGLHKEADLTDEQRLTIVTWAKAQMDTLKAHYPADSLVLRRPQGPAPTK